MSAQLLILLFALVVEDEDLLAASLVDDFAGDARFRSGIYNTARLGRNREHVGKFDAAIGAIDLLDPDHVSRGHLVLLATSADHRVHNSPPRLASGLTSLQMRQDPPSGAKLR